MIKAAFLDRDGVINQKPSEGEYITRWEDFRLLPLAAEGIVLLNRAGFRVIVVTNQRCVAKGLLTTEQLEIMHQRMTALLAQSGATIDAIYYCPHEYGASCDCRKPSPGMLFSAGRAHHIDVRESWMVGDSDIDVQAGRNAGCKTVRIVTDPTDGNGKAYTAGSSADILASSLFDAARQIIQWNAARSRQLIARA